MARQYYKKRKYSPQKSAAMRHINEFNALETKLGPAVSDVKEAFFALEPDKLQLLLSEYKKKHGIVAGEYAANTFDKWRLGYRQMSGQTMDRLLNLVPKYLSTSKRYDITKKVCEYFALLNKTWKTVRIDLENIEQGMTELKDTLDSFYSEEVIKTLPDNVLEAAIWLNDNDVIVGRALYAQIEKELAYRIHQESLKAFTDIKSALRSQGLKSYNESFFFPNGTINVVAYKKSKCYVATEVYGRGEHSKVIELREYRDRVLTQSNAGRKFIVIYYNYGYSIAKLINKTRLLVPVIKGVITMILVLDKWSLKNGKR